MWIALGGGLIVVILFALLIARLGPGRPIASVEVPGEGWGELTLTPVEDRGYRIWARVDVEGPWRSDDEWPPVAAEIAVHGGEDPFHAVDLGRMTTLYWAKGSSSGSTQRAKYTVLLWRTTALKAGVPIRVQARVRGVEATHVRTTLVFVSA